MTRNSTRRTEPGILRDDISERHKPLVGLTFGQLRVLGYTGARTKARQAMLTCACACGSFVDVRPEHLKNGNTTSCGCVAAASLAARNAATAKHGATRNGPDGVSSPSQLYTRWASIKNRCFNVRDPAYPDYGGRGITMHATWVADFAAFETWVVDVLGPRPPRGSIDRIDNNGNYEPGNLRWATSAEQSRNRRVTRLYALDGAQKILADWAAEFGIAAHLVEQRVTKYGWSLEDALTTPAGGPGAHPTIDTPAKISYGMWDQIKRRCYDPAHSAYPRYGAKQIQLHAAWHVYEIFVRDLEAEIGPRPSARHSLDRVDGRRGYEPGNLRWATALEQGQNRENTLWYTLNGARKTLQEWAALAGVNYHTVYGRITQGWSLDDALGTPSGNGRCPDRARQTLTQVSSDDTALETLHALAMNVATGAITLGDTDAIITRDQLLVWREDRGTVFLAEQVLPVVEKIIQTHVERNGWLFPEQTETAADAIAAIREVPCRQDTVLPRSPAGHNYLQAMLRSFWETSGGAVDTTADVNKFRTILAYRLGLGNSKPYTYTVTGRGSVTGPEAFTVTLAQLRTGLKVNRAVPSFFRPAAAAAVWTQLLADHRDPVVWDPSGGFGGRMLGFAAAYPLGMYTCTEPATKTARDLTKLAAALTAETGGTYNVVQAGSEYWAPVQSTCDAVFTSPPYFDKERYFDEPGQCWRDYPTLALWARNYVRPTIFSAAQTLKPGGRLAINVSAALVAVFDRAADLAGLVRTPDLALELRLGRDQNARVRGQVDTRVEPVRFWQKLPG